jgi:dipeptidase E
MLVLWKEWGLDVILREAYQKGIVLGGVSAGSICWFEQGVTDSLPGSLSSLNCLGILSGSNCPHYDGEKERRPSFHRLMQAGMKPGIGCDDGAAAYFVDEKLVEFVSSRKGAKAFQVEPHGSQIIEKEFLPRYLGSQLE